VIREGQAKHKKLSISRAFFISGGQQNGIPQNHSTDPEMNLSNLLFDVFSLTYPYSFMGNSWARLPNSARMILNELSSDIAIFALGNGMDNLSKQFHLLSQLR